MLGATQAGRTRIRVRVSTSLVFWCSAALGAWLFAASLGVPGSLFYFWSNFIGGLLGVALAFLTLPVLRWHAAIAGLCSSWIFLSITFWSPMNRSLLEASTTLSGAIMTVTAAVAALGLDADASAVRGTTARKPPLV